MDVANYVLNEKRDWVQSVQEANGAQIVLIGNPDLETPNYSLRRVRDDELGLPENAGTSYKLLTPKPDPSVAFEEVRKPPKAEEAAVTNVLPSTPAPTPPPPPVREAPPAPAPVAAAAPAPAAKTSLFARLFGWLRPAPARVAEPVAPVRDEQSPRRNEHRDRDRGRERDREPRGGEHRRDRNTGRNRNRNDRGDRSDRPQRAQGEGAGRPQRERGDGGGRPQREHGDGGGRPPREHSDGAGRPQREHGDTQRQPRSRASTATRSGHRSASKARARTLSRRAKTARQARVSRAQGKARARAGRSRRGRNRQRGQRPDDNRPGQQRGDPQRDQQRRAEGTNGGAQPPRVPAPYFGEGPQANDFPPPADANAERQRSFDSGPMDGVREPQAAAPAPVDRAPEWSPPPPPEQRSYEPEPQQQHFRAAEPSDRPEPPQRTEPPEEMHREEPPRRAEPPEAPYRAEPSQRVEPPDVPHRRSRPNRRAAPSRRSQRSARSRRSTRSLPIARSRAPRTANRVHRNGRPRNSRLADVLGWSRRRSVLRRRRRFRRGRRAQMREHADRGLLDEIEHVLETVRAAVVRIRHVAAPRCGANSSSKRTRLAILGRTHLEQERRFCSSIASTSSKCCEILLGHAPRALAAQVDAARLAARSARGSGGSPT